MAQTYPRPVRSKATLTSSANAMFAAGKDRAPLLRHVAPPSNEAYVVMSSLVPGYHDMQAPSRLPGSRGFTAIDGSACSGYASRLTRMFVPGRSAARADAGHSAATAPEAAAPNTVRRLARNVTGSR